MTEPCPVCLRPVATSVAHDVKTDPFRCWRRYETVNNTNRMFNLMREMDDDALHAELVNL